MNKLDVRQMRKDPSVLLSRVLYELSSTVLTPISKQELNDFCPNISDNVGEGITITETKDDVSDSDESVEEISFGFEQVRDNKVLTPTGDTVIEANDKVVMCVLHAAIHELEEFLFDDNDLI